MYRHPKHHPFSTPKGKSRINIIDPPTWRNTFHQPYVAQQNPFESWLTSSYKDMFMGRFFSLWWNYITTQRRPPISSQGLQVAFGRKTCFPGKFPWSKVIVVSSCPKHPNPSKIGYFSQAHAEKQVQTNPSIRRSIRWFLGCGVFVGVKSRNLSLHKWIWITASASAPCF